MSLASREHAPAAAGRGTRAGCWKLTLAACCLVNGCAVRSVGPAPTCPPVPAPASEPAEPARAYSAEDALQYPVETLTFQPGPPGMPGVEQAVLEGDPKQPVLFTMRLKLPAGFVLPPHTHPAPERVTVITGRVAVGFGSEIQPARAHTFEAGSFYVNPPGVPHFVLSDEGAVVQITGQGPWQVERVAAPP